MNKHVKRKWLRALRSGEYGKGAGRLVYTGRGEKWQYCCLGVLVCEMVPEYVKVDEIWRSLMVDGASDFIPDDLAVMYGVDDDTQSTLANLNDKSDSFAPVIAYIEEHL